MGRGHVATYHVILCSVTLYICTAVQVLIPRRDEMYCLGKYNIEIAIDNSTKCIKGLYPSKTLRITQNIENYLYTVQINKLLFFLGVLKAFSGLRRICYHVT